jgi:hypothetical protein
VIRNNLKKKKRRTHVCRMNKVLSHVSIIKKILISLKKCTENLKRKKEIHQQWIPEICP